MLGRIVFFLILASNLMALRCSDPITLLSAEFEEIKGAIFSNPRGDFAAYWLLKDAQGDKLQAAIKPNEGAWTPVTTLAENGSISNAQLLLDEGGDIDVFWIQDKNSFKRAQKKRGEPWSNSFDLLASAPSEKGQYFSEFSKEKIGLNLIPHEVNSSHVLSMFFYDKKTANLFIDPFVVAQGIYSPTFSFNKQRDLGLLVWSELVVVKGWLTNKYNYSLEGAWVKEGTSQMLRETICYLNADTIPRSTGCVIDSHDHATVIWFFKEKGEIKIKATSNREGKWSTPIQISAPMENVENARMGCDDAGNILVIWTTKRKEGEVVFCHAYKPVGEAWILAEEISLPGDSRLPELGHDHTGHFVVAWTSREKETDSVWGATLSTKDRKWSDMQKLSPEGEKCFGSALSLSESGKAYIGWVNCTHPLESKIQVAQLSVD